MSSSSLVVLVLCLLLVGSAHASRHEITQLPGWEGTLPSRMFTGQVPAGTPPSGEGQMYVNYWLVESENDPSTDPLVLWYQGGPGASSLFGLLVEFGPLLLNDQSLVDPKYNQTGIPQLIRNPNTWSKRANLMVVDNPPPVGFSYCEPAGPTGKGTSCGAWNDSYVAVANHRFLGYWLQEFPEYRNRDMYITGESYAGIYVPIIAEAIMDQPIDGLKLAGFAVGDGCMGTHVLCGAQSGLGPYWSLEFMYGHGQFSNELYNTIRADCPTANLRNGSLSAHCHSLINQAQKEIGGYYGYALYDPCGERSIFLSDSSSSLLSTTPDRKWWSSAPQQPRVGTAPPMPHTGYACPGPSMNMWLNRSDVRRALGVPVNAYFFSGDNGAGFNYTLTEADVLPIYLKAVNRGMRVLVYNGDTDPGINSFVTQDLYYAYMSKNLKRTQEWRPWTIDGKKYVAGHVFEFAVDPQNTTKHFSYLTIRGSGHMVPEFKGAAAQAFLDFFITGKDWPTYNPN